MGTQLVDKMIRLVAADGRFEGRGQGIPRLSAMIGSGGSKIGFFEWEDRRDR